MILKYTFSFIRFFISKTRESSIGKLLRTTLHTKPQVIFSYTNDETSISVTVIDFSLTKMPDLEYSTNLTFQINISERYKGVIQEPIVIIFLQWSTHLAQRKWEVTGWIDRCIEEILEDYKPVTKKASLLHNKKRRRWSTLFPWKKARSVKTRITITEQSYQN